MTDSTKRATVPTYRRTTIAVFTWRPATDREVIGGGIIRQRQGTSDLWPLTSDLGPLPPDVCPHQCGNVPRVEICQSSSVRGFPFHLGAGVGRGAGYSALHSRRPDAPPQRR